MKIFITGGLGFVGRHLSADLLADGHHVTAVGRSRIPSRLLEHASFNYIAADTTKPGPWQEQVAGSEVVINLTGRSIFTLWTESAKKEIYDSRILTTRNLVQALEGASETVFFSTSAIGFYGNRGEDSLPETEPPGNDFLALVCRDWEQEAMLARKGNVRVVLTRFGIILDHDGGAMASMLPAFRLFLGGRLGSGNQWFPWMHMRDLTEAFRFMLAQPDITGPVNCCAPNPVRNRDLTRVLAAKVHRPAMLPTPALVITTVLGEFGKTLLSSQRGEPAVLKQAGFHFAFPDIDSALDEIAKHR